MIRNLMVHLTSIILFILCHIRTIQNQFQDENEEDEEVVEMYDIPYLKNEVGMMIADYSSKHIYKTAKTLF
mgnify:CR=1 FL=1